MPTNSWEMATADEGSATKEAELQAAAVSTPGAEMASRSIFSACSASVVLLLFS